MMYSNYFVKPKRNANLLRFTPPGFKYSIDVPFPGRVLPVCARCKKNFKTREHCRTKECHYGLPWTDTYLCITLDPTCTSPDGKLLDGPFVAQGAANTAYQYSGYIDPKTPSCGPCKEKNYTRTYCRTTKKHKTLPWSTVYIVLTLRPDGAIPPADEEVNPEIVKEMNAKRRRTGSGRKAAAGAGASEGKGKGGDAAKSGSEESKEDKAEGGKEDSGKPSDNDDGKKKEDGEPSEREIQVAKLNEISPSRTFLATVSVEKSVVEWLEYDASQQANQNRMREEMNQKMQEGGSSFQPHYMMHPPMGMNPMGMNPPFQHHPAAKEDQGNGGNNGYSSNNSVGGNSNNNGNNNGGSSGGPPNQDGNNSQQQWNMNPHHPHFPSPQDMMYQGFDPRMAYGFHHPWGRGPMVPGPMDPNMMHFDGGQNPMMHQMGPWGGPGANFYNMHPPHLGNASHSSGGSGGGGEMPQSYESGSKAPSKQTNSSNQHERDDVDSKVTEAEETKNKEESV